MFSINNTYYNESIRKMVTAFGALFNSIYILRRNDAKEVVEKIRVPLIYGPKEKFIYRIKTEAQITDNTHVQITLPMIGFDMTSIIYDTSRKTNRLNRRIVGDRSTYSEVPYNINFGLYVFTRNIDDNLQIVEQILPYFAPEMMISINVDDLYPAVDIPIVLNSVAMDEQYEGSYETRRSVTSLFDFTVKGFVYNKFCDPTTGIIKNAELNMGLTASGYTASLNYVSDHGDPIYFTNIEGI
jgi:hypothetical protein